MNFKKISFLTALFGTLSLPVQAETQHYPQREWTTAPAAYFSGSARFSYYLDIPNNPNRQAIVEFEPNARTHWHSHSEGQYLMITQGVGYTQEWGKPLQMVKAGDVVWCPPNVKHWHGAAEHSAMSHIAISPNYAQNKVEWLEPVDVSNLQISNENQPLAPQTEPLSLAQFNIAEIAFYSARNDQANLTQALERGLANGLSVSELSEVFAHQASYAGFPRALNGILNLQKLLNERAEKGIQDKAGQPARVNAVPDFYQQGVRTLTQLSGGNAPVAQLANHDGLDFALKSHLFGYQFSRDNLSPINRELATVGTLISLADVPNQLRSHLTILHGLGASKADLQKLIEQVTDEKAKNSALDVFHQLNLD